MLVVPRRHADGLWDLADDEHAQVARAAGRVARLLRVTLRPAGVNLVHATGAAAWQTVFHFRTHVVPRYRPDELQPPRGSRSKLPTPTWPPCAPGSSARLADGPICAAAARDAAHPGRGSPGAAAAGAPGGGA